MGRRGEGWFLVQLVIFAAVLWVPDIWSVDFPGWVQVIGGLILLDGAVLGTAALICLGRNLTPFPKPRENATFIQSCTYGLVRHPIYTAIIVATLGFSLVRESLTGLILTVIMFVFFDLKSRKEETWLVEKFPEYVNYRKRVARLIPWVY